MGEWERRPVLTSTTCICGHRYKVGGLPSASSPGGQRDSKAVLQKGRRRAGTHPSHMLAGTSAGDRQLSEKSGGEDLAEGSSSLMLPQRTQETKSAVIFLDQLLTFSTFTPAPVGFTAESPFEFPDALPKSTKAPRV